MRGALTPGEHGVPYGGQSAAHGAAQTIVSWLVYHMGQMQLDSRIRKAGGRLAGTGSGVTWLCGEAARGGKAAGCCMPCHASEQA